MDGWKPELSLQHPKIAEYEEEILAGVFFVFDIGGKYIHQNPFVRQIWESRNSPLDSTNQSECSQCLVTGKHEPIARTHQKIKGVYNPQGQISEMSLVSFNDPAFESYGKDQSYNAPISESAMFKLTTALNYLLERESKNRIRSVTRQQSSGPKPRRKTAGISPVLYDPVETPEEPGETKSEVKKQDLQTRQLVNDILQKVRTGQHLEEKDLGVDPDKTKFYILGLAPNNARLAVRFWHEDSFGKVVGIYTELYTFILHHMSFHSKKTDSETMSHLHCS